MGSDPIDEMRDEQVVDEDGAARAGAAGNGVHAALREKKESLRGGRLRG